MNEGTTVFPLPFGKWIPRWSTGLGWGTDCSVEQRTQTKTLHFIVKTRDNISLDQRLPMGSPGKPHPKESQDLPGLYLGGLGGSPHVSPYSPYPHLQAELRMKASTDNALITANMLILKSRLIEATL